MPRHIEVLCVNAFDTAKREVRRYQRLPPDDMGGAARLAQLSYYGRRPRGDPSEAAQQTVRA